MLVARGKMKVVSVEPHPSIKGMETLHMQCEYDPDNPEDIAFSEATPTGELTLNISNANLLGKFGIGDYYYLEVCEIPVEIE